MRHFRRSAAGLFAAATLTLLVIGCSDNLFSSSDSDQSSGLNNPTGATLSVGFRIGNSSEEKPLLFRSAGSVDISSAKIVIGRIRFITGSGSGHEFRSDDPIVIDLDLTGATQNIGSIEIPPGEYEETRFRIEKLTDNDSAAFEDNPDMQDITIKIEGTIDGDADSAFIWTARFMEDQVKKFDAVIVEEGDSVELIFELDHADWFVDDDGSILDPRLAPTNGEINSDIENNIKESFKIIQE